MTALLAIPLIGMLGMGIDMTRAYIAQVRLQGAVDNAALAAATMKGESEETIREITRNFFYSNYAEDFWAPPAEPEITLGEDGNIRVTARAVSANHFLGLFGYREFPVVAVAEAVSQSRGLEVVMVLDVTGSMNSKASGDTQRKIDRMKSAAKNLVGILFGDETEHEQLRIGLVPFAASVQLDPAMAVSRSWIDTAGAARYARTNFLELGENYETQRVCSGRGWRRTCSDEPVPYRFDHPDENSDGDANPADDDYAYRIFTASDWTDTDDNGSEETEEPLLQSPAWNGCVEARPFYDASGNWTGLAENDTPPNPGNPDTLWVPYFFPDNPDNGAFNNNYVAWDHNFESPGQSDHYRILQRTIDKYKGLTVTGTHTGESGRGPLRMCAGSRILPMTNKKVDIDNAIDALYPDGFTHVAIGAAWGWRVISPDEPFSAARDGVMPYDDPNWNKAIIILTDGENTMPSDSVSGIADINRDTEYTAYGFASQARMGPGIDTRNEMVSAQNASLTRVCNNIKAIRKSSGGPPAILVYTITFGDNLDYGSIKAIMQGCATTPDNFFDARTGLDLEKAFEEIAAELSRIRLTK